MSRLYVTGIKWYGTGSIAQQAVVEIAKMKKEEKHTQQERKGVMGLWYGNKGEWAVVRQIEMSWAKRLRRRY